MIHGRHKKKRQILILYHIFFKKDGYLLHPRLKNPTKMSSCDKNMFLYAIFNFGYQNCFYMILKENLNFPFFFRFPLFRFRVLGTT